MPDFARHISVMRGSSVVLAAPSGTMSYESRKDFIRWTRARWRRDNQCGSESVAYLAMDDGGKRLGEATEHITFVTRI